MERWHTISMIPYHNDFILDMSGDNAERVPDWCYLFVNCVVVNDHNLEFKVCTTLTAVNEPNNSPVPFSLLQNDLCIRP